MNNENTLGRINVLPLGWQKFSAGNNTHKLDSANSLPEILFITSFPPRECGIATYSQDLIKALKNKFSYSFKISICPLESDSEKHIYQEPIKYVLNADVSEDFIKLAKSINNDDNIKMVMIQHEFGLLKKAFYFEHFLKLLNKPAVIAFHTVLPRPNEALKTSVKNIVNLCESVIVMTHISAGILTTDYEVTDDKITIIPHGTHLVPHSDKDFLKAKYNVSGRRVLSTFGLLSSGKSIETTLEAMTEIIKDNDDVLFLIIGKTHPSVAKEEGEKYRNFLENKVESLQLQNYVRFINHYLTLSDLLDYLQLTDIYLFTSKDPNQAVSGTFSYAISCGCPIISTPIPHAREVLKNGAGIIVDFKNSGQLSAAVINLLGDEALLKEISSNGLHSMAHTAWENAAIAHALLFENISEGEIHLNYKIPAINLDYVKKLTTHFGMIQFSIINQPDIGSGYTLDDNARALVAMCQHYELTQEAEDLKYIEIYLNFIRYCLQEDGSFLNYVDKDGVFTQQNYENNLADSNGRAIWALGYLISLSESLPQEMVFEAGKTIDSTLANLLEIHSTRAMAFIIKGLYYRSSVQHSVQDMLLITRLSNRLVQMYKHEAEPEWSWFESYLTYGNSILPEAMLCAWLATGEPIYKQTAKTSFDFLLSKIFTEKSIKVISNQGWLHKGEEENRVKIGGEQPIDITYTILALNKFYAVFKDESYKNKSKIAFDWFLGNNHLHQIIYNPCTGGCYDGLEESYINLNQGAESTVSYLMARLTLEKASRSNQKLENPEKLYLKFNRQSHLV
ncbi:glycosyl transferase [Emticicia aquatilis]|uniref:Glycosyl transferase n=1 Tax=Emticicia aquatilis TaxID=1537369 RepID=A0A916Z7B1_9BACT|nr:glycosyltransferase [Emticicia aquatilis]GGD80142.1 glycosyl transferase [Emticicia aquatilis]